MGFLLYGRVGANRETAEPTIDFLKSLFASGGLNPIHGSSFK